MKTNRFRRTKWAHQPKKVSANVVDKIKKLLALHESTTSEGEAQNALKQAQRLMAEHKLSQLDLGHPQQPEEVVYVTLAEGERVEIWKSYLATILSDNFGCVGYRQRHRGATRIQAFGLQDDVQILKYAYAFTMETAENLFRLYIRETGKHGATARKSFMVGFCLGLKKALETQRAQNQEWGLVLVTPEVVRREEEKQGIKRRTDKNNVADRHAMGTGYQYGLEHDPTRRRITN